MKRILLVTGAGLALLVSLAAVGPTASAAGARKYVFGVKPERTNLTFESRTDFETIVGHSNAVTGHVTLLDGLSGATEARLALPAASLKTGIDMRDEHLRSPMWLDAAKYPTIELTATSFAREGASWRVAGKLTLHGVTRDQTAIVTAKPIPPDVAAKAGLGDGDWIKVSTTFSVKLSDFGVTIPSMAAARVSDVWTVKFDAFAQAK